MIEKVLIKDFQSHRSTTIELDPHVSVLTGPSGTGKSAALRAIRWVLLNRPTGDSFVGRWRKAPYSFVKLWLDGHTISRSRGEGINEYRIDGKKLKAFGQGVPQDVADLACVSSDNFQRQHDGPYWLNLPAGEVSRALNEIVNLASIDDALSRAAGDVRKAKAVVDVSKDRLAQAKIDRDRTAWAVSLHDQIIHAESQFLKSEKLDRKIARLGALVSAGSEARREQKVAGDAIPATGNAVRVFGAAVKATRRVAGLRSAIQKMEECTALVETNIPSTERLDRFRKAAETAAVRASNLSTMLYGISIQEGELEECTQLMKECELKLSKMTGTRCYSCGQIIPKRR